MKQSKLKQSISLIILIYLASLTHFASGQSIRELREEARLHVVNFEFEKAIQKEKVALALIKAEIEEKGKYRYWIKSAEISHDLGLHYANIGAIKSAEKHLIYAFNTYREKLKFKSIDEKYLLSDVGYHLSELYLQLNNLTKAEKYIELGVYDQKDFENEKKYLPTLWLFKYQSIKYQIDPSLNNLQAFSLLKNKLLNFPEYEGAYYAVPHYISLRVNNKFKNLLIRDDSKSESRTVLSNELKPKDFTEALNYYGGKFGKNSREYTNLLFQSLQIYFKTNNEFWKSALEPHIENWLYEVKENFINSNDRWIKSQSYLIQALYFRSLSDWKQSYSYYFRGIDFYFQQLEDQMSFLSLEEQSKYWEIFQLYLAQYYTFCLNFIEKHPEKRNTVLKELINSQLKFKGKILQNARLLKSKVMNSDNDELIADYEKLLTLKKIYSNLGVGHSQVNNKSLNLLTDSISYYERKLISNLTFSKSKKESTYEELIKSLKKNEIVLEIIRIPTSRQFRELVPSRSLKNRKAYSYKVADSVNYMVIAITNDEAPEMLLLNEPLQLEGKYIKYYQNSIKFKQVDKFSFGRYLNQMKPLYKRYEKVYYSADGAYHLINPNILFDTSDSAFVFEENLFIKLTNSEEIIHKEKILSNEEIILFGRPEFSQPNNKNKTEDKDLDRAIYNLFENEIPDLPGTQQEVEAIAAQVLYNNTKIFLGNDASEASIKSISKPKVLHVATHGFFLNAPYQSELISMSNSGLLLSKTEDDSLEDKNDGIFTALDASLLNLEGTDLVVLSACETGLGKVKNGEGVYGLQRAISLAGANNFMMSSWKVSDQATRDYMISFYYKYLEKSDVFLAYKHAMIKLMEKYEHPYYWGAFMLIK